MKRYLMVDSAKLESILLSCVRNIQTESIKSFCLNVLCVLFCYGILFCGFLMLDGHLDCIFKVKLLLMIS